MHTKYIYLMLFFFLSSILQVKLFLSLLLAFYGVVKKCETFPYVFAVSSLLLFCYYTVVCVVKEWVSEFTLIISHNHNDTSSLQNNLNNRRCEKKKFPLRHLFILFSHSLTQWLLDPDRSSAKRLNSKRLLFFYHI